MALTVTVPSQYLCNQLNTNTLCLSPKRAPFGAQTHCETAPIATRFSPKRNNPKTPVFF